MVRNYELMEIRQSREAGPVSLLDSRIEGKVIRPEHYYCGISVGYFG